MTQDEIIEMARQAGISVESPSYGYTSSYHFAGFENGFYAFAKLIADKATDEANARANASWTLMCKKMVEAEREACLKLCEQNHFAYFAAEAIRARGQE